VSSQVLEFVSVQSPLPLTIVLSCLRFTQFWGSWATVISYKISYLLMGLNESYLAKDHHFFDFVAAALSFFCFFLPARVDLRAEAQP